MENCPSGFHPGHSHALSNVSLVGPLSVCLARPLPSLRNAGVPEVRPPLFFIWALDRVRTTFPIFDKAGPSQGSEPPRIP